jgi:hypothetical protein
MFKKIAISNVSFSIAAFATTIAVEVIIFAVLGRLLNTSLLPNGPAWILAPVSAGLTAWLVAVAAYLYASTTTSALESPVLDPANFSAHIEPLYVPSEAAYKNILLSLIALSSANGNVDKQKIIWIDALHAQWIRNGLARSYPQLNGTRLNRVEMSKIAAVSAADGPNRVIEVLQRRRNQMANRDKEILVKLCFFLAALDGPISRAESALIVEIASAVGISRERMLCWK